MIKIKFYNIFIIILFFFRLYNIIIENQNNINYEFQLNHTNHYKYENVEQIYRLNQGV